MSARLPSKTHRLFLSSPLLS
uniref:Uncharacterized protein n=1 Tax=Arundo donax TaxID=35708 RepID=A0A0A9BQ88_ARUDO